MLEGIIKSEIENLYKKLQKEVYHSNLDRTGSYDDYQKDIDKYSHQIRALEKVLHEWEKVKFVCEGDKQ